MNREFYLTHTVRYDECNCDGMLTPAAFLRFMQDIAALDAENAQLSGNGYWIVKRTAITFAAPITIHTRLKLKTYGIGFTRITAQRGYEAYILDKSDTHAGTDDIADTATHGAIQETTHEEISRDTPAISARTLWVYLDTRGRPIRLPDGTAQIWLPDGPRPLLPEVPLPANPEGKPETSTFVVRFSDIDPMNHLNNAASVEMLDNAAWEAYTASNIMPDTHHFAVQSYEIDYLDSPHFGETLAVQSWFDPLPASGQEFTRFQQITRDGAVMVRARSRWHCTTE